MEILKKQMKDLALLYAEYQKKENEKKNKHAAIQYLKDSLEILDTIDYSSIPDQSYVKKLDIILELILNENWKTLNGKSKYLQSKIDELVLQLQERHKQIQDLKQKEFKSQYKDIDEWVSEKNFFMVYDSKSKRQFLDLTNTNYKSEYALFLDMRNTVLTRGISCQNAKYFYKIATQIQEELELDIEKGKIVISEGVTELLSIAKLTRKNPNFVPSKEMEAKIDHVVKRKTILQAIGRNYY